MVSLLHLMTHLLATKTHTKLHIHFHLISYISAINSTYIGLDTGMTLKAHFISDLFLMEKRKSWPLDVRFPTNIRWVFIFRYKFKHIEKFSICSNIYLQLLIMMVAVGLDTLTPIMMKIQVFDDIMPLRKVNIYVLF